MASKEYYLNNKEHVLKKSKAWYEANEEYVRALRATPEWKAARKAKRQELKREKKRKAIDMLGGMCARCQGKFPLCCYDFHHKEGEDKNDLVGYLLNKPWSLVEAEIQKCEVLCANCHRIIHHGEHY